MNKNKYIYNWLEFLSSEKERRVISEQAQPSQTFKASATNPAAAAAFGDFEYSLSGDGDRVNVVNTQIKFAKANLVCGVNNQTISTIDFHEKYVHNLENAYYQGSKASGYCPKPSGGYVPRKVRTPTSKEQPVSARKLSNHSFGTAVDFNPQQNPYQAGFSSEMEKYPAFIEAFEKNGFRWLGDGAGRNGPGDDMHFDIRLNTSGDEATAYIQDTETGSDFSSDENTDILKFAASLVQDTIKESHTTEKKIVHKIFDKTDGKIYPKYKKYIDSLMDHLVKKLKIKNSVEIVFEDDEKNGRKVLGRTGGYINDEDKIHIFTNKRHIKDIMRSLSHEMVHHSQNQRGEFKGHEVTKKGYAQTNMHLRKMEEEAYLKGNILFRDWEDNYKYRGER